MFIYSGSSAVAGLGGTAGERLRLEALQGAAGRRAWTPPCYSTLYTHALHARFTRTLYTQSYVWRRLRQADPEFLAHTGGRDIPSVLHPRSPPPPLSLCARVRVVSVRGASFRVSLGPARGLCSPAFHGRGPDVDLGGLFLTCRRA